MGKLSLSHPLTAGVDAAHCGFILKIRKKYSRKQLHNKALRTLVGAVWKTMSQNESPKS